MKGILVEILSVLTISYVLAAPSGGLKNEQPDPIEEELIRHHHAVLNGMNKPAKNEANGLTMSDNSFEALSRDPSIQPINENEMYDITVGDVIRDVLLTLRDNPDIVKELIASEKEKLADQIDAYNQQIGAGTSGEELSQNSITLPGKQNNEILQADGNLAGIPKQEDAQISEKRADEVSNDVFTGDDDITADDSDQYLQFMNSPMEGGQNMPLFNYDSIADDNSESTNTDTKESQSVDAGSEKQDSEEFNERNLWLAYQLPFLKQNSFFRNFGGPSDSESETSNSEENIGSETNDNDDVNDISNEEELAWLLQKGRTGSAEQQNSNNNNGNDVDPRKVK
ncbi:hypothetical protein ACF0H5_002113 [Mactra antiquata]